MKKLTPDEASAAACACDLYADEFCLEDQAEADDSGAFGPREKEWLLAAAAKLATGGVPNFHPAGCDCEHEWCRTRRVLKAREALCGVVCTCGPNREPLACGYAAGHDGEHSWATLPTFPLAEVAQGLRLISLAKRRAKRDLERNTNAAALTVIYALEGAEEALAALAPKETPDLGSDE